MISQPECHEFNSRSRYLNKRQLRTNVTAFFVLGKFLERY